MLKFSMFADFHYKKGMYIPTVGEFHQILNRARQNDVDCIIHAGDFCNDYIRSPELIGAYLHCGLPAYGVYGNHELESLENSMERVTPLLTNDASVVYGTADGKIGDGTIAYYYKDIKGFRIICTDTNYSWNEAKQEWQHNETCSYGPPRGNVKVNSLGPVQLAWLKGVLDDAVAKELPCIVISHDSFSDSWSAGWDADQVRALFNDANARRKGTVMMAINGHLHTDHLKMSDGIVYFDVNTVLNGQWLPMQEPHYTNETFQYEDYDADGKLIGVTAKPVTDLWMSKQTWFFTDPVSAIITVTEDGHVTIEGQQTSWRYGIVPEKLFDGTRPNVMSGEFQVER